jgi:hypothetical protein
MHRMDVELLARQAEAMAARTVVIDDAVRAGANPQLVIVGAGLDGHAWRMREMSDNIALQMVAGELSVPDRHLRTSRVAVAVSGGGPAPVRR